jgi:hypothetical protein
MAEDIVAGGERNWSQQIIDLYTKGGSDAEVAAFMRVTIKAFYKNMDDNQAFKELVEFGRTLSQSWWESQFRKNVNNKNFNSTLLTFYMKNKHGWADKMDTSSTSDNLNVNLDELRTRAIKEVEAFIKKNTPELTDAQRVIQQLGADISVQ